MAKNSKMKVTVRVGEPVLRRTPGGRTEPGVVGSITVYAEDKLPDLIRRLEELVATYGAAYTGLHLQSERDCGCRYDCSCSPSLVLYGTRLESDIEYDHRVAKEASERAARAEIERRQYEALKAKFEGKAKP